MYQAPCKLDARRVERTKTAQELLRVWTPTTRSRRNGTIDCAVSEMMQPKPGLTVSNITIEGEN